MHPSNSSGTALYERAKQLIPGGTQLLSKRPEMFAPESWPAYYQTAAGCELIDTDGRTFVDLSTNGIGACLLGYADPDVTAAVVERVQRGSMCSLNTPDEVALAELLLNLHPWAEQARYARTGGEAMAIAVRIARAKTGRDRVAFCGYHGWSDWYLAANLGKSDALDQHLLSGLKPSGVPFGLKETALPFRYNRLDELQSIVQRYGPELAAVVMEPTRNTEPLPGFLESVKEVCDRCGAALILDEISMGWRLHLGGAHLRFGIDPDIAVFAKSLANGHPMAAVIGKRDLMQAAQTTFISSTYWTESVGPAAALATLRKMQHIDVPRHVATIGETAMSRWRELAAAHGVAIHISGYPAMVHWGFEGVDCHALGTLFTKRMLELGFLVGPAFYPTLAHQAEHLDRFSEAADEVFFEIAAAIRRQDIDQRLNSPVRHQGFQRLT